jgi:hypothetical protein
VACPRRSTALILQGRLGVFARFRPDGSDAREPAWHPSLPRRTLVIRMGWDEDELDYGYLLERCIDGSSWYLHFGRARGIAYYCKLLRRETNIFASVSKVDQRLRSPLIFCLTLDGESVSEDLGLDCRWGKDDDASSLAIEARHFQRTVMPLLFESSAFQSAVSDLVFHQRRASEISSGRLLNR